MAHGLPVVAIAKGGIPEVVEDGKNGVLLNSEDPEELASAIAKLHANRPEAGRLGTAARETIAARFSARHMVDRTQLLYEEVIAEYSRKNPKAPDAPFPRSA
jgi:glycosyltransferase involved in cell wall biosynthesis